MDEDGRGLTVVGALVILACGLVLRVTDRLWLVDWFDAPSFSEAGNLALGIAVAAAWYTFPLLLLALPGWLDAIGEARRRHHNS